MSDQAADADTWRAYCDWPGSALADDATNPTLWQQGPSWLGQGTLREAK
jgi:hypothetical protein